MRVSAGPCGDKFILISNIIKGGSLMIPDRYRGVQVDLLPATSVTSSVTGWSPVSLHAYVTEVLKLTPSFEIL
jgi:hypothetical protein